MTVTWVKYFIIAAAVVSLLFFVVVVRRASKQVVLNRTNSCVEDVINAVDSADLVFDVDTGVFIEDPAEVAEDADKMKNSILDRGSCVWGLWSSGDQTLLDHQYRVDETASAYLGKLSEVAERFDQGNNNEGSLGELQQLHEEYLEALDDFDEAALSSEDSFLPL